LAPPAGAKASRLHWPGLLGLAISILLLWWALRGVALRDVLSHLRHARPVPLLGAVVFATAAFPLRTLRWRYLLRRDGSTLPLIPLWHATAIGFMANNLLPARAGELARSYAAGRLTGVRFTAALGSVAVERVLDGLVLVGLLGIGIALGGFAPGTSVGGVPLARLASVAALLFVPALAALVGLVHWPGPALTAAGRVLAWIMPASWAGRVTGILEGLLGGLDALKSPRRFAWVAVWSVVTWVVSASSYALGFLAFGLPVPMSAAMLLQGLIAFGVAIPSSPGFFGPFEAVTRATLALYGVSATPAVTYAVAYHITTFAPITLLGLWSLSRAHLHLAELRTDGEERAGRAGGAEGA
jgi:uncharacterized protein (TIRG00374 family)